VGLVVGKQTKQNLKKDIVKTVEMQYLLYLPDDYNQSRKDWPLMLFLHGAGERGNDIEKVKVHGPPKLIENGKKFPFLIVSPQCPEEQWWDLDILSALLDDITETYKIDKTRIYLTGLSMGGYGTWGLATQHPERFAAIAPICGGGNPKKASVLNKLPVWAFHGAKDQVVPLEQSQLMIDAIKKAGGNPRFTIYPEAEHDSWTESYDNQELYEWFLQHKKEKE